jgi:hypothetical protein
MNFIKALYEAPTIGIGIDSPRKSDINMIALLIVHHGIYRRNIYFLATHCSGLSLRAVQRSGERNGNGALISHIIPISVLS